MPQSFVTAGHPSSLQMSTGGELPLAVLYTYRSVCTITNCRGTVFPFVCKSVKSLMEVANCFPIGLDVFSTGGNLHLAHKSQSKPVVEKIMSPVREVTLHGLLNGYDVSTKIPSK